MRQLGFLDLEEREEKLTKMGDPLVGLNARIDWEAFRADLDIIHIKPRKSNAGAKPIDVVLMFKLLVLQQLHNLSDDQIEYQIRDRFSFMRFLGLHIEDRVPDAKTVWLFRERLKDHKLIEVLFERFHEQLALQGYIAKAGQMIDATFIEVPRQRNRRKENAQVKAGKIPPEWKEEMAKPKLCQKDLDARWTKKNFVNHYGYKNHINADQEHKLVHSYKITDASVHDSQVFEELLDHKALRMTIKNERYTQIAPIGQRKKNSS
jgi:IS5 family transposase